MSKIKSEINNIPLDIRDIADFKIYEQALNDFKELEEKANSVAKRIARTYFFLTKEELQEKFNKKMLFEYFLNYKIDWVEHYYKVYDYKNWYKNVENYNNEINELKNLKNNEKINENEIDNFLNENFYNKTYIFYLINYENKIIKPYYELNEKDLHYINNNDIISKSFKYSFLNKTTINIYICVSDLYNSRDLKPKPIVEKNIQIDISKI